MVKINDITKALNAFAPEGRAEDFDNVGLLVGDPQKEIDGVLLTLDVDETVAREAEQLGAGLIISHHPMMFSPIKNLTPAEAEQRTLRSLLAKDIAVYTAHTNLDAAQGGLNDFLVERLGFSALGPLSPESGLGRVCALETHMMVRALAGHVKTALGCAYVRYTGDGAQGVARVGICSGGGAGLTDECRRAGLDAYITGDIKYNHARELSQNGIQLIEVNHFDSEIFCCEIFRRILTASLAGKINIFTTKTNTNVFTLL